MRTLLMTLAGLAAGYTLPYATSLQGPSLHFEVTIDGTSHRVAEGKKTTIKIGDAEHQLSVAVAPLRHFAAAGLEFDFPRTAIFEHEPEDEGTESWSIDTSNLTFMITSFSEGSPKMMAKVMLDATIDALESEADTKPRSMKLGGKTYKGVGATVTVADNDLDITMLGMQVGDKTVVLTIQDMLTDDGKIAPDSKAAMAVIAKTFELTNK